MPSIQRSRRNFLTGTAVCVTGGIAGCTVLAGGPDPEPLPDATPGVDDWPATGYDARNSRYNAGASPPRSKPTPQWTHDFPYCHKPFIRGTRVVLNAGDRTVGLRATDGEQVWRSDSKPWGFETPTLGPDRAYATGVDCVFGVDLDSGDETWHGQPCHGANTVSGMIANGRLYLEYGGYFSALDAAGRVTWASRHDAQGSPAVTEQTAYVTTVFTVAAVDLTATANEWPWEDRDDDEPAHATRSEATKWSVPSESRITGPRIRRSPAVSGASVYMTVERDDQPGGELRALTRDTGEERWAISSPPDRQPGEEPGTAPGPVGRPVAPVVTDDSVVTALGDRRLRALSHGGATAWTRALEHEITDVIGAGTTIIAATHDRSVETTAPEHTALRAFDLESGDRLWELTFKDHVEGLAAAGDTIYTTVVINRQEDGDIGDKRLVAFG
jgi:outer membrane protein assembly factor BamB